MDTPSQPGLSRPPMTVTFASTQMRASAQSLIRTHCTQFVATPHIFPKFSRLPHTRTPCRVFVAEPRLVALVPPPVEGRPPPRRRSLPRKQVHQPSDLAGLYVFLRYTCHRSHLRSRFGTGLRILNSEAHSIVEISRITVELTRGNVSVPSLALAVAAGAARVAAGLAGPLSPRRSLRYRRVLLLRRLR
jgi:hypothetical protein